MTPRRLIGSLLGRLRPSRTRDAVNDVSSCGRSRAVTAFPDRVHAANVATPTAPTAVATPLAALLTQHILRDGEVILLALRPSVWFILLSSLGFVGAVCLYLLGVGIYTGQMSDAARLRAIEVGLFLVVVRIAWAVLQWVSRLYILTNLRILRLAGVFYPEVFDCPLRKVARARLTYTVRERIVGLGSIEIIPLDENQPTGVWQTIARPRQVHEQVLATITRVRQGGAMGCSLG